MLETSSKNSMFLDKWGNITLYDIYIIAVGLTWFSVNPPFNCDFEVSSVLLPLISNLRGEMLSKLGPGYCLLSKLLESLDLLSKPCFDFYFLLLLLRSKQKSNIQHWYRYSSGRTTHHLINLIKCPILTCFLNVSKLFWWLDRKYFKVFNFSQAFCKKGPQVKYIQHSRFF